MLFPQLNKRSTNRTGHSKTCTRWRKKNSTFSWKISPYFYFNKEIESKIYTYTRFSSKLYPKFSQVVDFKLKSGGKREPNTWELSCSKTAYYCLCGRIPIKNRFFHDMGGIKNGCHLGTVNARYVRTRLCEGFFPRRIRTTSSVQPSKLLTSYIVLLLRANVDYTRNPIHLTRSVCMRALCVKLNQNTTKRKLIKPTKTQPVV